jgi:hypothetical protein
MGREALDLAQRPVPLHLGYAELSIGGWWQIAERAVWPDGVVVYPPDCQCFSHMVERGEDRLVQQLVAQPSIKTLDEGILLRLAWRDVMPLNPCLL